MNFAALTPDGLRLIAVMGASLVLWDVQTGENLGSLIKGDPELGFAALSPDGAWLATSGPKGVARLWLLDITKGRFADVKRRLENPIDPRQTPNSSAEDFFRLPWSELQLRGQEWELRRTQ